MGQQLKLEEFHSYNEEYTEVLNYVLADGREKNEYILNPLKDYYLFINTLVKEKKVFRGTSIGMMTLLSKGSLDLLGIHSTLSTGCVNQSFNILRSLFESYVNLLYINSDFKKLMSLFEGYSDFAQYYKWKDKKEELNFPPKIVDELTKKYKAIKRNYQPHRSWYHKPLLKEMERHPVMKHWDKKIPSIKAMCIVTNQEERYNSLYNAASESVHGSSLVQNLLKNEKNNISLAPKFDSDQMEQVAVSAVFFLSKMVEIGLSRQPNKDCNECASLIDFNREYVEGLYK